MSAAAWQLGVGLDACALASAAGYDLAPGARAWVAAAWPATEVLTLGGGLELQGSTFAARTDVYTFRTTFARAAPTLDLGVGTGAARFVVALGPAVAARSIAVAGGEVEARALVVEPGARFRLGVDVAFGAHGTFRWHVGTTSRAGSLDHDAGLGVGWRW